MFPQLLVMVLGWLGQHKHTRRKIPTLTTEKTAKKEMPQTPSNHAVTGGKQSMRQCSN